MAKYFYMKEQISKIIKKIQSFNESVGSENNKKNFYKQSLGVFFFLTWLFILFFFVQYINFKESIDESFFLRLFNPSFLEFENTKAIIWLIAFNFSLSFLVMIILRTEHKMTFHEFANMNFNMAWLVIWWFFLLVLLAAIFLPVFN